MFIDMFLGDSVCVLGALPVLLVLADDLGVVTLLAEFIAAIFANPVAAI
jgi:hypothetical protein